MIVIYDPSNTPMPITARKDRKTARRDFSKENGCKWGHLWLLGYRCRSVKYNRSKEYEFL
jgi:hypothetical protein